MMLVVITFISCKKSDVTPQPSPQTTPTKDMVVNSTFDWKTSKEITLNVIGMKDVNPNVSNTLIVKSSNGDMVYYKEMLVMHNDYTLKFAVPTTETKVNLVYGSKTATIDLVSNTITYNYQ